MAPSLPPDVGLDCFYYISVYPGYGVEIKVSDLDPAGAKLCGEVRKLRGSSWREPRARARGWA